MPDCKFWQRIRWVCASDVLGIPWAYVDLEEPQEAALSDWNNWPRAYSAPADFAIEHRPSETIDFSQEGFTGQTVLQLDPGKSNAALSVAAAEKVGRFLCGTRSAS